MSDQSILRDETQNDLLTSYFSIQTPGESDEVFDEDYEEEYYPDYQYDENNATQDDIFDYLTTQDETFDYTADDYETTTNTQKKGMHVKINKIYVFK